MIGLNVLRTPGKMALDEVPTVLMGELIMGKTTNKVSNYLLTKSLLILNIFFLLYTETRGRRKEEAVTEIGTVTEGKRTATVKSPGKVVPVLVTGNGGVTATVVTVLTAIEIGKRVAPALETERGAIGTGNEAVGRGHGNGGGTRTSLPLHRG